MMKISMSIGALVRKYGPDKGFAMMKGAGFDGVDFGFNMFYSYGDIVNGKTESIFGKSMGEVREFMRPYMDALKTNKLEMLQAHTPFPLYTKHDSSNEAVIEAAKKCIILCGEAGCPYLVVHPRFGDYDWRLDADTQWEVNREMYLKLLPYARDCKVGICLENMYTVNRGRVIGSACSDVYETVSYIDRLNDIAGEEIFSFCYDSGHQMLIGQDQRANLRTLGKRVRALHLHDNDARDDLHMPAYTGRCDWDAVLEGLKDIGFDQTLNFETGPAAFPEEVWPQVLSLIVATGRYFASRLEK